jgi:hypothetical protein
VSDTATYYLDYVYADPNDGTPHSRRDFIIIPTEFPLAIAGFQRNAPAALRLRAGAIVTALYELLETVPHVYKSSSEERISTKNQAWAALALGEALRAKPLRGMLPWAWHELVRLRSWPKTEKLLTLVSTLLVVGLTATLAADSTYQKALLGIGSYVLYALYRPVLIGRIFPGR